ncbi:MAG: damage-inducible protein DinB [Rhizobacter sp.]|nr:damage-inducible protein DinB [Ferruginibacter sp.]
MANELKIFFTELFEYNLWCNQQLDTLFAKNGNVVTEKSVSLYNHILNAHQIWNNRILPKLKTASVWDIHPAEECVHIDKFNYEHSLFIINNAGPGHVITYTNSRGQQFSNSVNDILYHVINHATYHRAQIATEFKQAGITPLSTDYIFFKR